MVFRYNSQKFSILGFKLYHLIKGSNLKQYDDFLFATHLTVESNRPKRGLRDLKSFKANDFRNFLYYLGPACLKMGLNSSYFQHFLAFVVAIRLLTQEKLHESDIRKAFILLNFFVRRFKTLYGESNMRFNVHALTHLALQATRWGPLHKATCFSFEGLFKIGKECINGTRGFASQLYEFFTLERLCESEIKTVIQTSIDIKIVAFLKDFKQNYDDIEQQKPALLNNSEFEYFLALSTNIVYEKKRIKYNGFGKF